MREGASLRPSGRWTSEMTTSRIHELIAAGRGATAELDAEPGGRRLGRLVARAEEIGAAPLAACSPLGSVLSRPRPVGTDGRWDIPTANPYIVSPDRGSWSNSLTNSAIRSHSSDACASEMRACRMKPHNFPSRYAAADSRAATSKSLKSRGRPSLSPLRSTPTRTFVPYGPRTAPRSPAPVSSSRPEGVRPRSAP